MILNICNRQFDSKTIRNIIIKDDVILIDDENDFIRIPYDSNDNIKDAKNWLEFKELTETKLTEAANIIIMICEHYINEYNRCEQCPLQRTYGCIIQNAPINWQR